jgi:hypothetical protein
MIYSFSCFSSWATTLFIHTPNPLTLEKRVLERDIKDHLADAVHQSITSIGEVAADENKSNNFSLHQRFKIKQLINITNESEALCSSILQKQDFDLDASIEQYFQHYNSNTHDSTATSSSEINGKLLSPDEKSKWTQLKNITQASDIVCETILRKHKFDLNASIEAFYRGDYST